MNGEPEAQTNLPDRKHLQRLSQIWVPGAPLFFVTVCVEERRRVLADSAVAGILVRGWELAPRVHDWQVGRYVVMPDHVHFFVSPCADDAKSLSIFVGCWKRSTAKAIRKHLAAGMPCPGGQGHTRPTSWRFSWQKEFFDHLLRSSESYGAKWGYVQMNPVRAGLVAAAEKWPYQGEIAYLRW